MALDLLFQTHKQMDSRELGDECHFSNQNVSCTKIKYLGDPSKYFGCLASLYELSSKCGRTCIHHINLFELDQGY